MRVYCRQTKAIVFARLIEQGLTSPSTQSRLSGRQFYGSKGPTNIIKVLKEKKDATKVKTRSQAVARIADRTAKNCRGHVT